MNVEQREQILTEATKWLLEMQFLDNPQIKTFLISNIYSVSKRIRDVNIILDSVREQMLVYIELDWIGRLFGTQKKLEELLLVMLSEVLPSFRLRIVFDKDIFELALRRADEFARGQIRLGVKAENESEKSILSGSRASYPPSPDNRESSLGETELRKTSDLLPDSEKSSKD